jgi:hypothetical protein
MRMKLQHETSMVVRNRLHISFGFFVEIGHRELGPERTERFSAAPRNRVIVGDANDDAPLAFEQLGWGGRDQA